MNLKAFFVATLQTALDESIATPDDILKHATADVLAEHLPRPLWARLLTACVGAPRVDAQLVIETIGVPNLCEHVPSPLIWACIAEIAARSLGQAVDEPLVLRPKSVTSSSPPPQPSISMSTASSRSKPLTAPPPDVIQREPTPPPMASVGPSIPSPAGSAIADIVAELEADGAREERTTSSSSSPSRARTPTQQRFRQSQTSGGRLNSAGSRRPQAQAAAPVETPRRGETEVEVEVETASRGEDWRTALAVEDEQLVDWQSSEETLTSADDYNARKR